MTSCTHCFGLFSDRFHSRNFHGFSSFLTIFECFIGKYSNNFVIGGSIDRVILTMSGKKKVLDDKTVATMMNEASACGMAMPGLADVLSDYFASTSATADQGETSSSDSGKFFILILRISSADNYQCISNSPVQENRNLLSYTKIRSALKKKV